MTFQWRFKSFLSLPVGMLIFSLLSLCLAGTAQAVNVTFQAINLAGAPGGDNAYVEVNPKTSVIDN